MLVILRADIFCAGAGHRAEKMAAMQAKLQADLAALDGEVEEEGVWPAGDGDSSDSSLEPF